MSASAEELSFIIEDVTTGTKRKFQRTLFPNETRRKLSTFCDCALSLNESSFFQNPMSRKGSLHFANDGSITHKGAFPPDEDINDFLHRLRPIYLQDEETNFNKIANLVKQHISDDDVTGAVKYWQKYYDGHDSQKTFTIKIKEKILNSSEFFDNYVNALEYHRDHARRKYIDFIAEHFPLEAQKSVFVFLLGQKMKVINQFASFIGACLEQENGQPIILRKPSFHREEGQPIILPK
jgi:hypothetical protein